MLLGLRVYKTVRDEAVDAVETGQRGRDGKDSSNANATPSLRSIRVACLAFNSSNTFSRLRGRAASGKQLSVALCMAAAACRVVGQCCRRGETARSSSRGPRTGHG